MTDLRDEILFGRRRRANESSGEERRRGHCWISLTCESGVNGQGCVDVSTPCCAWDVCDRGDWADIPRSVSVPFTDGNKTLTFAPNDKPGQLGPTETKEVRAGTYGLDYFDFRFLGEPQQCSDPVVCEEFSKEFLWDTWMDESK